ncbi:MAG TPA: phosphonate C-P lyase system protein PhnG [Noviherbaspirillum sp.]|uniref:phosphonate C-P lyase system protein PhnG n=1 Tax=Noviherbaspirillum sp. TaxID=1926288 RepID=UPI002DEB67CA|nr:phosphonate C-P lyase system protein PhnG [Noviherbaspirillum sp.]
MKNQAHSNKHVPERAQWISLLAKAPGDTLAEIAAAYGVLPTYQWLRQPEIGLAMVRARTGGTGAQFNLGEMTVTRCALRLHSGQMGVAYVAGRDVRHAEYAAVFDALMQSDAQDQVRRTVLQPIESLLAERRSEAAARAQATKVDFMTMVRGEDA